MVQPRLKQLGVSDDQIKIIKALPPKERLNVIETIQKNRILEPFKFDPVGYARQILGVNPWSSPIEGKYGQKEILDEIGRMVRIKYEEQAYLTHGIEPTIWDKKEPVQTHVRIESGHSTGKTYVSAMAALWALNCHGALGSVYAPTASQFRLLFPVIEEMNNNSRFTFAETLKTNVLRDKRHKLHPQRAIKGVAVNRQKKSQSESIHGLHGKFLFFICEEAVGLPNVVFDAIDRMCTGGVYLVIMIANPRHKNCAFHRIRTQSYVRTFQLSSLNHVNVVTGKEHIIGGPTRSWVKNMIEKHCTRVDKHNQATHTFELEWLPNQIFEPTATFLYGVMGITPDNQMSNVFITTELYQLAVDRSVDKQSQRSAESVYIGIDPAGDGDDDAKIYMRFGNELRMLAQIKKGSPAAYKKVIKTELVKLKKRFKNIKNVSIRYDNGGGYGIGIEDQINQDFDLTEQFEIVIHPVHFQSTNKKGKDSFFSLVDGEGNTHRLADAATYLYALAGQMIHMIAITKVGNHLSSDLTDRLYQSGVFMRGVEVKKLTKKDDFRAEYGRSSDDGDAAVLALCPEHLMPSKHNSKGLHKNIFS